MSQTKGLHHITAIAADPQRNLDFYEGFLGQRFVKRTVNFDDPSAYHLYYGDYVGSPGTAMTFFSWQGMPPATPGSGETNATYYRIPSDSLTYWQERAGEFKVKTEAITVCDESALSLHDPDHHQLYLVASQRSDAPALETWSGSPVPPEHQLMGFYAVRLAVQNRAMIEPLLTQVFGYTLVGEFEGIIRYGVDSALGSYIDIEERPHDPPAKQGVGAVHHIALRAEDDEQREAFRAGMLALGLQPTGLVDRTFFHSTYSWTPAGILFEVATDEPGFTVNEPAETLGENLVLPEQYERLRPQIEAHLPPIELPRHRTN